MIETEAKVDEDRPKIARVIYNRSGTAACRCRSTPRCSTARTADCPFDDAAVGIDTPYNTYLHTGSAADADRQPRPGLDPGRAQPGAEPVAG